MNLIDRDLLDELVDTDARSKTFGIRYKPWNTMADLEFRSRFRLSIASFHKLASLMKDDVGRPTRRSASISVEHALATFLHVIASNSFQPTTADMMGVSQKEVSNVVAELSDWFASNINLFVNWPSVAESKEIAKRVFDKHGLPGISGFIDGTHIRIIAPSENEKNFHSLNVSAVVDDTYKFIWFDAKYPGSANDSTVLKFPIVPISSGWNSEGYAPERASKIVAACICIRNFMLKEKEAPLDVEAESGDDDSAMPNNMGDDAFTGGEKERALLKTIALNYFK